MERASSHNLKSRVQEKFWTLAVVPHAGQIAWTERARAVVRALGVAEIRSYCAVARTDLLHDR